MRRITWGLIAVPALAVLVAGGCSSGGGDDASSAANVAGRPVADAAKPRSRSEDAFATAGGNRSGSGGGNATSATSAPPTVDPATAQVPGVPRSMVYTAAIAVRVRGVEGAVDDATAAVERAGGFLFTQRASFGRTPSVVVTYKVPPERFSDALRAIGRLGRVVKRDIDADDVTGRVVDLQARVDATRTSVERLRALLAQSGGLGDLLTVERELAAREGELESLEGQLGALRGQVDRATIEATFTAKPVPAATTHEARDLPAFPNGIRRGAGAFVNVMKVGSAALGFALPFVPLLAAIGGVWLLVARRQSRTRGASSSL